MTAHDMIHKLAPVRKIMQMARNEAAVNTDSHSMIVKDLILDAIVYLDAIERELEPQLISEESHV